MRQVIKICCFLIWTVFVSGLTYWITSEYFKSTYERFKNQVNTPSVKGLSLNEKDINKWMEPPNSINFRREMKDFDSISFRDPSYWNKLQLIQYDFYGPDFSSSLYRCDAPCTR